MIIQSNPPLNSKKTIVSQMANLGDQSSRLGGISETDKEKEKIVITAKNPLKVTKTNPLLSVFKKPGEAPKKPSNAEDPSSDPSFFKKSAITFNMEGDKLINQYKFLKPLGKGAFGQVELVEDTESKEQFAAKIQSKKLMKKKALTVSKDSVNMLMREIAIMKKIDHPNLVRLHEVIEDDEESNLIMILDYMDCGELGGKTHLQLEGIKGKTFSEEKLRKFYRECIQGLDYRKICLI